ncbi:hypothetical protein C8R43DRAFT_955233 [Mycena crocata]|nr:hypothetical protein C8R43DRAFT_955233 [Mycena crocata]
MSPDALLQKWPAKAVAGSPRLSEAPFGTPINFSRFLPTDDNFDLPLERRSPRNSLSEESTSSIDPPVQEFRICCLPVVQTHRLFRLYLHADSLLTTTGQTHLCSDSTYAMYRLADSNIESLCDSSRSTNALHTYDTLTCPRNVDPVRFASANTDSAQFKHGQKLALRHSRRTRAADFAFRNDSGVGFPPKRRRLESAAQESNSAAKVQCN